MDGKGVIEHPKEALSCKVRSNDLKHLEHSFQRHKTPLAWSVCGRRRTVPPSAYPSSGGPAASHAEGTRVGTSAQGWTRFRNFLNSISPGARNETFSTHPKVPKTIPNVSRIARRLFLSLEDNLAQPRVWHRSRLTEQDAGRICASSRGRKRGPGILWSLP